MNIHESQHKLYTVAVLLAAYNGEQYIEEQIKTIITQKNVSVTIFISIDLSIDNTLNLCNELSKQYTNIVILPYGERFGGAARNFYRLLLDTDLSSFDYVSLADQDDLWYENKLERAIKNLQHKHVYSSNVVAFWDDHRRCLISKSQPQVEFDYFFEAAGPGCTYVLRENVAKEFKRFCTLNKSIILDIALHDWLIYAFCRANNYSWFIDPEPTMLYRQHQNNQVGANNSFRAFWKRIILIRNGWYIKEVLKIFEIFDHDNKEILPLIKSNKFIDRFLLACKVNKLRRRFRDRLFLFAIFVFRVF
ncbi:alpha-L-Rha alpha-1,3-L-rhamnosyltransferase [Buttiauxella gaviniae ATCC 51604]|uniref:Alpha-L-Rha alpha-1,3-L-rhamnosyltransferase n=1 Tax=Buttiauxella gaviniae ATCC 51604 TaxID=1354253 RepID=A0A1B7I553_9ENTR|nr:glycosyltransferase [Buttiauxella gaviniae]OAT23448.1 alpha-L-Rha alpha-1,3-L-rhamnosyltransferase [Buttiauxella gaviniae ATCC 51604]